MPGVRIRVEAHPLLFLAMAYPNRTIPYNTIDTIPPLNILEGEIARLCAYQGGYGNAIAKGVAADGFTCPDLGAQPLPVFPVVFSDGSIATGPPHPVPLLQGPRISLSEG